MAYSLAFVPNDILTPILVFVDCVSLIRVYQCGDNRLNDRLLKSVTRFDLVYSNYVKMKFPIIIRHFTGLKSLTVQLHNGSERPICDYDLASLPNSLTSLHVPQERPLFEIQISPSNRKLQPPVLNLSALFPNLTSLVTPIGWHEPSESACLEWIEKLPRNLIEMGMHHLPLTPEHIAALPKSLRRLETKLTLGEGENRDWNFPPDLRYLSLPCQLPCAGFEKYLPLQLESLVLDPSKMRQMSETCFENLPRSLKVLENADVTIAMPNCFDMLPSGLERLTIGYANVHTTAVVYPACLKEIHGISSLYDPFYVSFISALPSGVTGIDENLLRSISSEQWHLLPRKLRNMSIRGFAVSNVEHALHLPPDLEEALVFDPSQRLLELLPKNITTLTLRDVQKIFTPSILNPLSQLKTLYLGSNVIVDINDFTHFSPKLTSLALQRACSLEKLDLRLPWASQLNEFLGETYLSDPDTEEDLPNTALIEREAEMRKTKSFQTLAWWTHFSHTLTSIIIYGRSLTLFSSHINLLPPHLTTMNISGIIIDEDLSLSLRRLPRAIQSVNLYDSIIQAGTNQQLGDIEALPPNLTYLSLRQLENKKETISLAKKLRPWLDILAWN